MDGYPHNDGTWTFYQVQSLYDHDPKNKWGRYTWVDRFDNRERVEALGLVYEDVTLQASGKVWQQSGIHGTTSLEYARVLLRLCIAQVPEHAHRIVQMTVSRETIPLASSEAISPAKHPCVSALSARIPCRVLLKGLAEEKRQRETPDPLSEELLEYWANNPIGGSGMSISAQIHLKSMAQELLRRRRLEEHIKYELEEK